MAKDAASLNFTEKQTRKTKNNVPVISGSDFSKIV